MTNTVKTGKRGQTSNVSTPSPQQIRSWINRQRTLKQPSLVYMEWLRKQFRITVQADVIKKEP